MSGDQIFEILNNDCKPYLDTLKNCDRGNFLVRGYFYQIDNIKEFEHDLENRRPKSMPQDIHDKINNYFQPIFNWKIRNGIFCYGFDILNYEPRDLGYGIFYLFFPKGEFSYVYSPEHFDLFGYVNQSKNNIDDLIQNLHFTDSNFCEVMNFREEYDRFGNEVSIKATSYYLVNASFAEKFTMEIWG